MAKRREPWKCQPTWACQRPRRPLPLVAATSARPAAKLLELAAAGMVEATGLLAADDHLATIATHGDPGVLDNLAGVRLAALDAETPASRARLIATLRAWLDHQGEVRRGWPASLPSTRRPSGTVWHGFATASATRSTIRSTGSSSRWPCAALFPRTPRRESRRGQAL